MMGGEVAKLMQGCDVADGTNYRSQVNHFSFDVHGIVEPAMSTAQSYTTFH